MAKGGPFTVASRRLAVSESVLSDFNGLWRLLRAIATLSRVLDLVEPSQDLMLKEPANGRLEDDPEPMGQHERLPRLLESVPVDRLGAGFRGRCAAPRGTRWLGVTFFTAIFLS
jgi:hypothetical protein